MTTNDLILLAIVIFKAGIVWLGISMAKAKNRSPLAWGIIVFVSSIIGTIILLVLPEVPKKGKVESENN